MSQATHLVSGRSWRLTQKVSRVAPIRDRFYLTVLSDERARRGSRIPFDDLPAQKTDTSGIAIGGTRYSDHPSSECSQFLRWECAFMRISVSLPFR